jgi:ATP phosphoribosyltransferase
VSKASPLIIALPKGRIFEEVAPLFKKIGLEPDADFFDEKSRSLQFATNKENVSIVRVRSFDVATFVAYGAAQIGICGSDVLMEFDYPEIYVPLVEVKNMLMGLGYQHPALGNIHPDAD